MKTDYLVLGGLALGAYMLANKNTTQTVGNTGLTRAQYTDVLNTENIVPRVVAANILAANDTNSALAIGMDYLNASPTELWFLQNSGVTSPGVDVIPSKNGGVTVLPVDASITPDSAVNLVKNSNFVQQNTSDLGAWGASSGNPYTEIGGAYPRNVNGIMVQSPNQMEQLRIAWENAQRGESR